MVMLLRIADYSDAAKSPDAGMFSNCHHQRPAFGLEGSAFLPLTRKARPSRLKSARDDNFNGSSLYSAIVNNDHRSSSFLPSPDYS